MKDKDFDFKDDLDKFMKNIAEIAKNTFGEIDDTVSKRERCLNTAKEYVCQDRNSQYDEPENSFENIARFWSAYLDVEISSYDVCAMMGLLKVARIKANPLNDDNWIDLAGYAACGYEVKE